MEEFAFCAGLFSDQYVTAVKELLKKEQQGEKIEVPREREPAKVINLIDALRRSVEAGAPAQSPRWRLLAPHRWRSSGKSSEVFA